MTLPLPLISALGRAKLALMEAASTSDRRRLRVYGDTVRCRPGCNGCCSRYMVVTVAEAVILYEHLKKTGEWGEVREKAEDQYRRYSRVSDLVWFKMNISCAVLDGESGLCRAHPVRPPACSTHFAASDPELCRPWSSAGGKFRPVRMQDVFERCKDQLRQSLADYGVMQITLPMPVALLLAERISVKSGTDLHQAISLIRNELSPSNRTSGSSRSTGS